MADEHLNHPPEPDELSVLAHQAAGMDAQQQAEIDAASGKPQAAPVDPVQEMASLFDGVGIMLEPVLPATGKTFQKNAPAMGAAFNRVAEKYGWDVLGGLERWAPEIGVMIVMLPVAGAVRADLIAIRQAKAQEDHEREEAGRPA